MIGTRLWRGLKERSILAPLLVGVWVWAGCRSDVARDVATVQVYAASSLTEVFEELAEAFEGEVSRARISLNLAGSQVLRMQIEQGAGADVFASANPVHMQALINGGRVQNARVFAHNRLVLIVPPENPAGIESLRDLPRVTKLVIGTEEVPVGHYAREVLRQAERQFGGDFERQVLARVVSGENNVRLVRAKVELGEADAALVYQTDLVSARRVRSIPISNEVNVRAEYTIGVVDRAENRPFAERWIEFICSPMGQEILSRHGFEVS